MDHPMIDLRCSGGFVRGPFAGLSRPSREPPRPRSFIPLLPHFTPPTSPTCRDAARAEKAARRPPLLLRLRQIFLQEGAPLQTYTLPHSRATVSLPSPPPIYLTPSTQAFHVSCGKLVPDITLFLPVVLAKVKNSGG